MVAFVGLGSAFGRALRRVSAEVRPMHVRVIIFIMFAFGTIIPYMPLLFGTREYEWMYKRLRVLNPIAMLELVSRTNYSNDLATGELIALGAAALLGLLLNVRPIFVGLAEVLRQPLSATSRSKSPAETSESTLAEQPA